MPSDDLKNLKLLGDTTEASSPIFCDLFEREGAQYLPKFKQSVQEVRHLVRAFSANASFGESVKAVLSGKTPYGAILKDIKSQSKGSSFGLVANVRYVVNASHPEVAKDRGGAGGLQFLASKALAVDTFRDELYPSLHRLLIEQHVYAFTWNPNLSTTYHVASAGIAVAGLAASAAASVATVGAAAPALIQSLRQAASATSDIVKLVSSLSESVDQLTAIRDVVQEAGDQASQAAEHLGAVAGSGAASGFRMPDRSGSAFKLSPKTVSSWGGLFKHTESEAEVRKRVGKAMLEIEKELGRVNFVVIQQITPMIQIRDNIDVSSANPDVISFKLKTYIANRSILRAGETDRDTFNRMVVEERKPSLDHAGAATTLCWPWPAGGLFARYISTPGAGVQRMEKDPSVAFVRWNDLGANEWVLADETPGTLPLPDSLLKARAGRQRAEREAAAKSLVLRTHQFGKVLAGKVQARKLQDTQEKLRQLRVLAQVRGQLPDVDQFKRDTTTKTGPFVNKRNNPKLLMIDMALVAAREVSLRVGQDVRGGDMVFEEMRGALHAIAAACEEYLAEKLGAVSSSGGRISARALPVQQVRLKVIQLLKDLN